MAYSQTKWNNTRIKYETEGLTLEQLAKKTGISLSRLKAVSAKEKWAQKKAENDTRVIQIVDQKINEKIESIVQEKSEIINQLANDYIITKQRVLQELASLAFTNIKSLFDDKGNLIPIHELDDMAAAAISGIEVTNERTKKRTTTNGEVKETVTDQEFTKKIKLWDKKSGIELLMKHLGLLTPEKDKNKDEESSNDISAMLESIRKSKELIDND